MNIKNTVPAKREHLIERGVRGHYQLRTTHAHCPHQLNHLLGNMRLTNPSSIHAHIASINYAATRTPYPIRHLGSRTLWHHQSRVFTHISLHR